LLADILGCGRAAVEERERRRTRRQRVRWGVTVSVVLAVLIAALHVSSTRGRASRSNELAGRAMSVVRTDPELAALLGLEAVNEMGTAAAVSALRVALAQLPDLQIPVAPGAEFIAPRVLSFSPDGRRLAIADGRTAVQIVDVEFGTAANLTFDTRAAVARIRWSPDGRLIAVVDTQHKTVIEDAATSRRVAEADGELHWRDSAGTTGVPAVIVNDSVIRLVELEQSGTWRVLNEVPNPGGPLSPDGQAVAVMDADTRELTVTDLETGRSISREVEGPVGLGLFWSPKGRFLVGHELVGFAVIDTRSLATVFSIDTGNQIIVEDLSISPDETQLVGTQRPGSTILWDIRTKQEIANFFGQQARAYRPVFSPDGRLLSVVYANGRAELFDVHSAEQISLASFDALAGEVIAVDFSPDARRVFVQYESGPLAVWNVRRWHPEYRLPLGYDVSRGIANVRMSEDGGMVGIQNGQTFRMWSTKTGEEVFGLDNRGALRPPPTISNRNQFRRLSHDAEVQSEAISPDGACFLTASAYRMASGHAPTDGNVVRLWDAASETLLMQWHYDGNGPDGAFFAGAERVVVFYGGEAQVYRTPLCESLALLRELGGRRVTRTLTIDERESYLGGRASTVDLPTLRSGVPFDQRRPRAATAPASPPPAVEEPARVTVPAMSAGAVAPHIPPSFDCARASTAVETMICNDAELATLDIDLTRAYRAARMTLEDPARRLLTKEQNGWIRARAACARSQAVRACVEAAYRQRLTILQTGPAIPPRRIAR
jgi:WD40 repeat protein/uncharacterized protein YecT (DUF1311 family)